MSAADRPKAYHHGERRDFIDALPADPDRAILEIGCGDGATAAYAKVRGKCGRYVGVEISAEAGAAARQHLDELIVGDIEALALTFSPASFDVLIASEVLEHLVDPWTVLARLRPLLRSGGLVMASSPNIAHKSTLRMLLAGRWDLEPDGRMDRTHLRWFTPASYRQLFESAGFSVISLRPLVEPTWRARLFNFATGGLWSHLFVSQMVVQATANPV